MARKAKKIPTRDQQIPRMGRPTLYRPEYCQMLIDHMSSGLSFESFGGRIDVARRTLYEWEKAFPEFLHAKEVGQAKSQLWWEEVGCTNVHSPSGQWTPNVFMFTMRSRFGLRDGYDPMKRRLVDGDDSPPPAETNEDQIQKLAEEITILAQNSRGR
jgi:hypothetical protein